MKIIHAVWCKRTSDGLCSCGSAQRMIDIKRTARMRRIDDMEPELRSLVNEYGFRVVDTCMQLGVIKPKHIRHMVETVLDEFSPTRGSHSSQGADTYRVMRMTRDAAIKAPAE